MNVIKETRRALKRIDPGEIDRMLTLLRLLRKYEARLFFCGNGGGAAHASHATCDFRKIAGIESYCINDNVAELTARINDDGWDRSITGWLDVSRVSDWDRLFVFSVGGCSLEVSNNINQAIDHMPAEPLGICGESGGHLAECGTVIRIPSDSTPVVEGCQAVIWHHLVTELAC